MGHSISLVDCAVLTAQKTGGRALEHLLVLEPRPGRAPAAVLRSSRQLNAPLRWRCADGVVEQLAIATDTSDLAYLIGDLNTKGILVAEGNVGGDEEPVTWIAQWE